VSPTRSDPVTATPRADRRIAVLISGRGSNLQAIIEAVAAGTLDATVALVLSNRAEAQGLARAKVAGIDTLVLRHADYSTRDEHDRAIAAALVARGVRLVCLAGFMRLIGAPLLEAFPRRILNIHPSLLPAFPGLNAQQQALEYGVRISGATVHLVTDELDGGPIVFQAPVSVRDDDTVETLAARILVEEHRIYPQAIQLILDGAWSIQGRRVQFRNS
jgi:phosphoribosylglycinamide formyltransferase 1